MKRSLSIWFIAVQVVAIAVPLHSGAAGLSCSTIFAARSKQSAVVSLLEQIATLTKDEARNLVTLDGSGGEVFAYSKSNDARIFVDKSFEPATFERSKTEIVTIFNSHDWGGGRLDRSLVMAQGDVFGEGYYRQRLRQINSGEQIAPFSDFIQKQTWLEWQPQSGTYKAHTTGSQERLIQHLQNISGNTITLYRGFRSPNEVTFLKGLMVLSDGQLQKSDARVLSELVSSYAESSSGEKSKQLYSSALESLKKPLSAVEQKELADVLTEARYESGENAPERFFFSNIEALAKEYSGNGEILKITIDVANLQKLSQSSNLYIGIEFNFYEVLFKGSAPIKVLLPNMEFKN
ncbi:hypothetical protein [Bdellovibrio sp. HCB288]|uniref:hypothetical protein n=1 Tax=Bdellovibrio sp. HCB288 TaxID=3394355 RepID=UPI0039B548B5